MMFLNIVDSTFQPHGAALLTGISILTDLFYSLLFFISTKYKTHRYI